MLHPSTRLQYISDDMGYGIFATKLIPAGSITYIKDALEIEISDEVLEKYTPKMLEIIHKYSYTDGNGNHVLSWDLAKYVNHHCTANTLSTGYGFEIAIRDIQPGEELTDDYGLFNLKTAFECACGSPKCRKTLRPSDFETQSENWDSLVRPVLPKLWAVDQALWSLIDDETMAQLDAYKSDESQYLSVKNLQVVKSKIS